MERDKKPEPCQVLMEAIQHNDAVYIDLLYPRLDVQTVKAIVVGLVDVRAADDIRIEFDFERNGWRLSMRREQGPWFPDERPFEEVSFVPAWLEGKGPANPVKAERDELLAALKELSSECDDPNVAVEREHHSDWIPPSLAKARALIARIEGKT